MINGFSISDYAIVAPVAMSWRAFENSINVAGFTGDSLMLAGQRKASSQMVEVLGYITGM